MKLFMRYLLTLLLLFFAIHSYSQFDLDAVAQSDSAIGYFTGLIEKDKDPLWFMARSYVYAVRGKYKKARKDFDYAVQFYQPLPDTLLDYSAKLYAVMGKHKKAKQEAEFARQLYPDNPAVHLLMGEIHALKGDTQTALSYFNQTALLFPDFAEAYYSRGVVNRALSLGEATVLPDLQMAVELSVRDSAEFISDAVFELAHYLEYLQKYDTAIYYYNILLELDSNNYQLYDLGHRFGECYFFSRAFEAAIPHYISSWALSDYDMRNEARLFFMIGYAYLSLEKYSLADEYFSKVINTGVKEYVNRSKLFRGICHYELQLFSEAKIELTKAKKKWYSEDPLPYYYLGMIELNEGYKTAACENFKMSSKFLGADDVELKEKLEVALLNCE